MGIISKLFSLIFKEEDEEWNDNITSKRRLDDSRDDDSSFLSDYDEDDDDEIESISDAELNRFNKALERFYSRLSQREMDDEDLNDAVSKIQDDFFEHKIKDPAKALESAYQQWRSSKKQREQRKMNNRTTILDMLRRFDELSPTEKESLTDYESEYCVRHLKQKDEESIVKIVRNWVKNLNLDKEKFEILDCIDLYCDLESELRNAADIFEIEQTPLTKEHYNQRVLLLQHIDWEYGDEEQYAEWILRYWLESGNTPEPISTKDLIVNRPCYLKTKLDLVSPHFHMGRRYYEEDSFQKVTLYLFEDALEYISDGGHSILNFSDIIEITLNNWCSEKYPPMLEITRRNSSKTLFSFDNREEKVNLLIMRALIFYFRQRKQ